ncbi:MAG: NusG domain II-containing protein [Lachnospiraceae bacterium]
MMNKMKSILKIKKELTNKDVLLIIIIIFVAGMAFLLHEVVGGKGAGCVTVKVEGEITGVYSLAKDQEIEINDGSNILVIKNGRADMIQADCPDKLCVNQKAISKNGESIICLPNKVVVTIDSSENSEFDAVAQ